MSRSLRTHRNVVRVATLLCMVVLGACGDRTPAATEPAGDSRLGKTPAPAPGFTLYGTKGAVNVTTTPAGGVYLAGGGSDLDAGMRWLLQRGGQLPTGRYGDVVVLRTSGTNGYNKYFLDLGANSVTSIVITTRDGANAQAVVDAINKAEVLFIAGGDQSTYVKLWAGTRLQSAVNTRINSINKVPIGGTSAGLAVLGEYVYSALNASAVSATVMANPYDVTVTLTKQLFDVPVLRNVITDSHFVVRDRMGRLMTFLARLQQDGLTGASSPRAIAVDEGSGLAIAADGLTTTTFGTGAGVYFLNTATVNAGTTVCSAGSALTYRPVTAVKVQTGQPFNVSTWTGSSSTPYTLAVTAGTLSSVGSSVY